VAAGEEFELQLGVDDQIRVERTLRRRSTGKAVIGGTRTIDVATRSPWRTNRAGQTKGQRARPHPGVHRRRDQGPAPGDEPGPGKQTDLGELTWELALDGGQEAAVRYRGSPSNIRPRSQ